MCANPVPGGSPARRAATALFCLGGFVLVLTPTSPECRGADPPKVTVSIVEGGESHLPAEKCRKMIVGPGLNQPDPFPGYGGFVGWECPVRLRDGTMYVSYSAGYWHASPPTPLKLDPARVASWKKIGFPADFTAPRGGRAMIAKSTDGGATWSKPRTLLDTPNDDRHPSITELSDGTLLCHYGCYNAGHLRAMFSTDGGRTWVAPAKDRGFLIDRTYGYSRSCLMPDGSAYLAYIGTGGHRLEDAQNNMIWSVRLRVRPDHSGVELIRVAGD